MDTEYNIVQLLEECNKITIPMIQRDYVQGRVDKAYIRKAFLSEIYDSLSKDDAPLCLDYIYGYSKSDDGKENKVFFPLDGQQRFTTLWLVYWYIALKADALGCEKDKLMKFTYETRNSSRKFFEALCNEANFVGYNKSIAEYIKDQTWFYSSWEKDPTIQAILITLGGIDKDDGIEKIIKKPRKGNWADLLKRLKNIRFFVLSLDDKKLPARSADQLYVRMNARGKKLTDFENFKPDFLKFVEQKDKKTNAEVVSKRINDEWEDLFWKWQQEFFRRIDNETVYEHYKNVAGLNTDQLLFSFINRFCFCHFCVMKDKDGYVLNAKDISLIDNLDDYANQSEKKKKRIEQLTDKEKVTLFNYDYLYDDHDLSYESFDPYDKVLTNKVEDILTLFSGLNASITIDDSERKWSEIVIEELQSIVNDKVSIRTPDFDGYSFFPEYSRKKEDVDGKYIETDINTHIDKGGSVVGTIKPTVLKERCYFYAVCKYFECNRSEKERRADGFKDWLYFCRNLIENADVDNQKTMVDCLRMIDDFGEHSENIVEWMRSDNDGIDIGDGYEFEISKASGIKLIKGGNDVGFKEGFEKLSKLNCQLLEELIKAQQEERVKIRNAEDHSFFCGCIRFLFLNKDGSLEWGDFDVKYNNIVGYCTVDKDKNEVKYDFVKNYAREFKSYDDVKELLIFHTRGWARRGDSWLSIMSDINYIDKTNDILLDCPNDICAGKYKDFVESTDFESAVKKTGNGVLSLDNLWITNKDGRWVLAKRYSQSSKNLPV